MTKEFCDICEEPLSTYYGDEMDWEPIMMKMKTAMKKRFPFEESSWIPCSICGYCRHNLANKRKEQEKRNQNGKKKSDICS